MGWIFFLIGISFVVFFIRDNTRRARQKMEFQLKPNCLLTRNPLLFVSGKKSLLYSLQYWGQLPSYLTQHGYEVHELDLPWRKDHERALSLTDFLQEQDELGRRFHLFFDESSVRLIQQIFSKNSFHSVASVTLVAPVATDVASKTLRPLGHPCEIHAMDFNKKSWIWKLHNLWTRQNVHDARAAFAFGKKTEFFFQSFLTHSVHLAERDFSESTSEPIPDLTSDASPGEPHHEQRAERFQRDLLRFTEFS